MGGAGLLCSLGVGLLVFVGVFCLLGGDLTHLLRASPLELGRAVKRYGHVGARTGRRSSAKVVRKLVLRQMPTFLDILTLGLSAGLSFDASMELYCKRYDCELSRLLGDAMLMWRTGARSRGEALRDMANEVDDPAISRFAATVEEALTFGTPLSEALERQAQVIRDEQKSRVEEQIEQVPVKMLIPLGTLIVPAMLLAILGPLLGPALSGQ